MHSECFQFVFGGRNGIRIAEDLLDTVREKLPAIEDDGLFSGIESKRLEPIGRNTG